MLPEVGGSIGSLTCGARDVLRPAAPGTADPLATACCPLVPYANRIAHGRFAWEGTAVELPRNFGAHPHSLHGIGWQRCWTVAGQTEDRATLALEHDGGPGWPWRFAATQAFTLDADGLAATLTLRNRDARLMPAGLGFHPYFPIDGDSRLAFRSARMWNVDTDMLATGPSERGEAARWAEGATVAPFLDNAFEGWDGAARLDDVLLTAAGAACLHLFIPEGREYCCIEPVSHGPDAINRDAMPALAPGASAALTMRIGLV